MLGLLPMAKTILDEVGTGRANLLSAQADPTSSDGHAPCTVYSVQERIGSYSRGMTKPSNPNPKPKP